MDIIASYLKWRDTVYKTHVALNPKFDAHDYKRS